MLVRIERERNGEKTVVADPADELGRLSEQEKLTSMHTEAARIEIREKWAKSVKKVEQPSVSQASVAAIFGDAVCLFRIAHKVVSDLPGASGREMEAFGIAKEEVVK